MTKINRKGKSGREDINLGKINTFGWALQGGEG